MNYLAALPDEVKQIITEALTLIAARTCTMDDEITMSNSNKVHQENLIGKEGTSKLSEIIQQRKQ